jgi:hypothetical protein
MKIDLCCAVLTAVWFGPAIAWTGCGHGSGNEVGAAGSGGSSATLGTGGFSPIVSGGAAGTLAAAGTGALGRAMGGGSGGSASGVRTPIGTGGVTGSSGTNAGASGMRGGAGGARGGAGATSSTGGSSGPAGNIWMPKPGVTWQWQLTGTLDTSLDVQMYDIDLFNSSSATIKMLHDAGRIVVCYFSAGSYEPDRPDSADLANTGLGSTLDGWPDEKWLDIRSSAVRDIMKARLDMAKSKGCDGVEPDNVDGYDNSNGLGLTRQDQLDYNQFLATEGHARGLSVGLKNSLDLVPDLVGSFDWALNEECLKYTECDSLQPFISAGKAVFHCEYSMSTSGICDKDPQGFSTIIKNLNLDAFRLACK